MNESKPFQSGYKQAFEKLAYNFVFKNVEFDLTILGNIYSNHSKSNSFASIFLMDDL